MVEVSEQPIVWVWNGDTHCGSTVGIMPPSILMDDGGTFGASKAQLWLWQCWQDAWGEVAELRKKLGAKLYVGFNGDLVDGNHHGTVQIVTGNPNAQHVIWDGVVRPVLDLKPDKMFFTRGTEAHVGKSGSSEESIAAGLLKDKRNVVGDPDTGKASWSHYRGEVQGIRFDATHHGRTGMREHTRGGAQVLYAHDIYLAHCKDGDPPPHLCIRSHYHRWNDSYDACPTRVIQLPAWQLATAYVKKVAADTMADIGSLVVIVRDGQYEIKKIDFKPSRGAVWKPE